MNKMKFRILYTDKRGEKSIIYDSNRYLIGLDGTVFENYGTEVDPIWEVPFDVAELPIVQRFTGCHDSNKNDIWEGDIISYDGRKATIEFFAGSFFANWGDETDDDLAYLTIDNIEVIGNGISDYKK